MIAVDSNLLVYAHREDSPWLSESGDYWPLLRSILQSSRVSGPQIHDARIAVICRQHGVSELWTADRDFGRFSGLAIHNPLVGKK